MSNKYQQSIDIICSNLTRNVDSIDNNPTLRFLETLRNALTDLEVYEENINQVITSFDVSIEINTLTDMQVDQVANAYAKYINDSINAVAKRKLPESCAINNLSFQFP